MSDVLIVDDEAGLRRLMRRCIEREGASVVEAEGAEEALRVVADHVPKVAFCDVELQPNRPNGFWLAAELNRLYPDTVVVMVTSKGRVDAVVTGVRAGSRVYLVKPVSPDQLRDALQASLEEHATRVRDGVSTRREPLAE
jgi:NtrC-family two-component system response regulator AlgB